MHGWRRRRRSIQRTPQASEEWRNESVAITSSAACPGPAGALVFACTLLSPVMAAECTNPTKVPDGTYISGDHSQVDNNALAATNFAVSGGATATFVAGNCIDLAPGFHASAIGATAGTTFHAWADLAPSAVSISPMNQSGLNQAFTWTVSSPAGRSNLAHVFALFHTTSASTSNACYIHYDTSSNLVYLADNASTSWLGGFVPSSSGSASNSQCTISGTGSAPNPTSSGTQLGLTLNVSFQASFSGTKNEYLYAQDGSGVSTGWQQMGTWTVPAPPVPDFTLSAATNTYYAPIGIVWPVSYTLMVTPQNGFNSHVRFSMSDMWGCTTPVFSPTEVTGPPWTTTLTMSCWAPGLYSTCATVLATGGVQSHQLVLILNYTSSSQYNLVTAVSPAGSGSISPASGSYYAGTQVIVTAAANPGYQFTGFSGSLTGWSPGYVTMDANKSVTANFTPTVTSYSLATSVNPSGSGTLAVSPACCTYNSGTQVTITAIPASGYQFSGWSGVDSSIGMTGYVTMNSNRSVTANFSQIATQYQLTTNVSPSGSGTLNFSPPCCTYNAGTPVTITASAASGYQFNGWTGVDSSNGSTGYATMNANRSVAAAMVQTPDLGQMTVWSSFVDRHELLVGPNGPTGPGANGGLYGLSGSDLSTVNTLTDAASQQLIQLQAQNLTGPTYVNQRSTILQSLNTQLHGQLSPASATVIDRYANAFLQPGIASAPQACQPSNADCATMHSEINFYNGGGSNFGLGAYAKSWVEGPDANLFTATVASVKESYSPLFNPPANDPSWQVIVNARTDNEPGGKGATEPHTESNPRRGTYKIESFHQFSLYQSGQLVEYLPPFSSLLPWSPAPPPATETLDISNGYHLYQTTVDLGLQVAGAQVDQNGNVVVTNCSSPIPVTAFLTPQLPSGNTAPPITWAGGTTVDNLGRTVPCADGTTVTVSAAIGSYLTAQVQVQVRLTYTISGTITTADGKGVAGITVDPQMNIRTDSNGHYSVAVAAGSSYIVQPNDLAGIYWFSPQTAPFTNISSNQTANFTANPVTFVYLIHGIGQTATNMADFAASLNAPGGLDPIHYHIDASFTFGCATSCGGACSVPPGSTLVNLGAQWLASYIQQQQPPGNIILIGYSMGGLIARDLIANNYNGVLTGHPVTKLITLGTPHLGYPYSSVDELAMCRQLLLDMSGSWAQTTSSWMELTSPYLDGLRQLWAPRSYTVPWMAAAGEQCSNTTRNLPPRSTVGCPSWSPTSDGVVCRDSAEYGGPVTGYGYYNDGPKPIVPWVDDRQVYVHTNSWAGWGTFPIMCGNSGDPSQNPPMFNPPSALTLFSKIKDFINAN